MAGIGDYIHYSAKGYQKHGTSIDGQYEQYQSQKGEILRKVDANAKSSLSKRERIELEKILSSFFKKENSSNKYIKMAQDFTVQKLNEKFGEKLQEINWGTGNVTLKEDPSNLMSQVKENSVINEAKFLAKINNLETILAKKASSSQLNNVKNDLENIKKSYKEAINLIKADKEARGLPMKITSENLNDLAKYREQVNNIIQEWAAYPPINLQKGDLFEYLISYAPMVAEQYAYTELGKVVGGVREEVKLDLNKFAGKYITKETKDYFEKTSVSQGKIDVEMKWNAKDLKISAKNINMNHRSISLLSKTSLLNLLQDEPADFVNHALNILSVHKGRPSNTISSLRPGMINELKIIILYKALTGDIGGRKVANLFIVNDNSTGKVKVYSFDEIINKAIKENGEVSGLYISGFGDRFKAFNNTWAATPDVRISNLLTDVHSRKISVSLNTSLLKSLT